MKDEPVYYGNNSTRQYFKNCKGGKSNSDKQWKCNNPVKQHKCMNTDKYGQKTTPTNSNGNITKCSIYQSIYHWYKECSQNIDNADRNQVKLSLFSKEVYNCLVSKFVEETLNHVLESRCTKTVCNHMDTNNQMDTLSADEKQVTQSNSDSKFKFQDGNTDEAINQKQKSWLEHRCHRK